MQAEDVMNCLTLNGMDEMNELLDRNVECLYLLTYYIVSQ